MSDLVAQVKQAIKDAMRAKDKERLTTLRMINAEFKRVEVDERIEVDDARALLILDKMSKQRRDAATQYVEAGRQELADKETAEIEIIQAFLPKQLDASEIDSLIDEAIASTGASGMQDMGKVMGYIKPKAQGRADLGAMSATIKAKLNA